jgi:hypothetical protein
VLAAVVADNLKSFWSIVTQCRLFRPAFRAPLWSGHVPLIKHFLVFFAEEKGLFALNASRFNVRHLGFLLVVEVEVRRY